MQNPTEQQKDENNVMSVRQDGWNDTYDTLLLRLDPSSTLARIEMYLRGLDFDSTNNTYVQVSEPKISSEGVSKLMIELHARISVDKVLGNLEETKINDITRETGEVILEFLWFNSDKYNIQTSDWESIEKIIRHNVYMFLRRSKDALQNKLIHESMKMQEISQRKGYSEAGTTQPNNIFSLGGMFRK